MSEAESEMKGREARGKRGVDSLGGTGKATFPTADRISGPLFCLEPSAVGELSARDVILLFGRAWSGSPPLLNAGRQREKVGVYGMKHWALRPLQCLRIRKKVVGGGRVAGQRASQGCPMLCATPASCSSRWIASGPSIARGQLSGHREFISLIYSMSYQETLL